MSRAGHLAALLLSVTWSLLAPAPALAADAEHAALWEKLKQGGYVVLIRHAVTDAGIGDPPGFRLGDCATQRNLSAAGREDARRIGDAFRSRGIPVAQVRSSRWCRCMETSRLAFGTVVADPMLDSIFREDDQASQDRVRAVREAIAGFRQRGNLVLVSHQQNILALTGRSTRSGEMLIVRPGQAGSREMEIIGAIPPDGL